MRRHPAYVIFMSVMLLMLAVGVGLVVWGITHQSAAPLLMVPRLVHHG
jgi:hypothetical protein